MNRTTFSLVGLAPDNLLSFLALLGTLRLLDRARPAWNARVSWSGAPLRPQLTLAEIVAEPQFIEALVEGIATIGRSYDFHGEDDLKFSRETARQYLTSARLAGDDVERVWSALTTDGALKPSEEAIAAPPLCTMLGQGHQHMLKRLTGIARGHATAQHLADALFSNWRRNDATDAFRWDPAEDRRYALRDVNPSNDPARTQHGGNVLAVFGLPLLTSVPTGRRGSAGIATVGFSRGRDRRTRITWPIWSASWDVETILNVMCRRELAADDVNLLPLRDLSVLAAYRSYRVEVGYYANFSWAEAITSERMASL